MREAAARRQIEEQRYRVLVDATIRRARQFLRTDPEGAYQDLKRQRDEIQGYDGLGAEARRQLVGDLEAQMREVFVKGAEIKRQADAERQALARTRQHLSEFDRAADAQASDKNRIDQFRQLMQHARYALAYQEAQLMVQEKTNKGLAVPPTATASYIIGQQATQLREWKELTRVREDRFLQAMMQTEKSHIPYPDEPPVHFPPAKVWQELTGYRKKVYENSNLGANGGTGLKQIRDKIEDPTRPVDLGDKNLNEVPLFELLSLLSKRYEVSFVIMEEYFNAEQQPNIKEAKAKLVSTQLQGLTLGNFLDIVLLSMNATYVVRPEYIEITTFNRRLEEKVTQVFPVADLVIPIPQSVNQRTLFQNQQFQNQSLAIFGQASLFGGGLQNIGGNFGNPFGAGGVGVGGNPLNAMGGGGPFGGTGQQLGNQGNLGAGGGITGITGGQLGQFGNLGGQFGLQGGDQSQLLMRLIFETVAKGEWANIPNTQPMPGMGEDEVPTVDAAKLNSLGYYPPARALIVRGTTRYHSATTIKLKKTAEGNAQGPGVGARVAGPWSSGRVARATVGAGERGGGCGPDAGEPEGGPGRGPSEAGHGPAHDVEQRDRPDRDGPGSDRGVRGVPDGVRGVRSRGRGAQGEPAQGPGDRGVGARGPGRGAPCGGREPGRGRARVGVGGRPGPGQCRGVPAGGACRGGPEEPRPGGGVLPARGRVQPRGPDALCERAGVRGAGQRRADRRGGVGGERSAGPGLEHERRDRLPRAGPGAPAQVGGPAPGRGPGDRGPDPGGRGAGAPGPGDRAPVAG
ncbi:hypothetical protein [Gemmata sp. SH-PL17]|uniref:hypothetical protein n=1 Tax=Gemmata sp. SH-PL17 TaxID=1630693 RepID=UPI0009EF0E5D|nr:hypothetical protein [Gemmata sp. SH-PL17]